MREIKETPILTDTYESTDQFTPVDDSLYIYRSVGEDRAQHIEAWRATCSGVRFKEIVIESSTSFKIDDLNEVELSLRSDNDISKVFAEASTATIIYLDITGLSHSVWAAILRVALKNKFNLRVVYVEPDEYSRSAAPIDGQIYDLSSRIEGISPLPGFAVLSQRTSSDFTFVPLLGFEGTRLRYVIEEVQPGYESIVPVIGSPGFKPWYVFETYMGNRNALAETEAWQSVRYAPANCPFSCFYLLQEIAANDQVRSLKIALVGTKPHALGAVLFALHSNMPTELVHDHPIRKAGRTGGRARLLVYHVSALFDDTAALFSPPKYLRSNRIRRT